MWSRRGPVHWGRSSLFVAAILAALPHTWVSANSAGDVIRADALPTDASGNVGRPNFSAMGRMFVHGNTGNVGVGDMSTYNDTAPPAYRLEVDGTTMLHGSLLFDNSNGESVLEVLEDNEVALTTQDVGGVVYSVVNTKNGTTEFQRPIHMESAMIIAKTDTYEGLGVYSDWNTQVLQFDTQEGQEQMVAHKPLRFEGSSASDRVVYAEDDAASGLLFASSDGTAFMQMVTTDGEEVLMDYVPTVLESTLVVEGETNFLDETQSTSPETGSVVFSGGVGVNMSLHVATDLYAESITSYNGIFVNSSGDANLNLGADGSVTLSSADGKKTAIDANGNLELLAEQGVNVEAGRGSTLRMQQGEGSTINYMQMTDGGMTFESTTDMDIRFLSSNDLEFFAEGSATFEVDRQGSFALSLGSYDVFTATGGTGAINFDTDRDGSAPTLTMAGDGVVVRGDLGTVEIAGNGVGITACGSFYGTTQCADASIEGKEVILAATQVNGQVTVAATADGGSFYGVTREDMYWQSYGESDTGITIVAGEEQPGYFRVQQQESYASSNRIEVDADGAIQLQTNEDEWITVASEGNTPKMSTLNDYRNEIRKPKTILSNSAAPATLATVRLERYRSASVTVEIEAYANVATPFPIFFKGVFFIQHNAGSYPEPDATSTPMRTGLMSSDMRAAPSDVTVEIYTEPDNSGGASVEKDFNILAYLSSSSTTLPSSVSASVVITATGEFVTIA
mmetsp:Transcript_14579/g.47860  ORF Transcript_14579/g.47860 Transcript_14579/m.47860 type:complete len:736 (-) Transcript_14579:245-2452(-)